MTVRLNHSSMSRHLRVVGVWAALTIFAVTAGAVDLYVKISPETVKDFERAAAIVESSYRQTVAAKSSLLPKQSEKKLLGRMKAGEIVTEKINNPALKVKGGLSHYWVGAMFDPNGKIEDYVKVLLDYPRHKDYYTEVVKSDMLSHDGDNYRSRLRLVKKKVLTAVLDVDFEANLNRVDDKLVYLRTVSTKISQVENEGTPEEKQLPVGEDSGFLWRQNSYWALRAADGGVYVELASFSLSRSIPVALSWMIKPFITGIPKDTITNTLEATREAVQ